MSGGGVGVGDRLDTLDADLVNQLGVASIFFLSENLDIGLNQQTPPAPSPYVRPPKKEDKLNVYFS